MEPSDRRKSSEDQRASSDSLLKDAIFDKQSQSASSSDDVQSMIIKVLDDIVVRVSESDRDDHSEKRSTERQIEQKSDGKRSKRNRNARKKIQQKASQAEQVHADENKEDKNEGKDEHDGDQPNETNNDESKDGDQNDESSDQHDESNDESKNIEQAVIRIDEDTMNKSSDERHPSFEGEYMDDDEMLNRQNMSPDDYNYLLNYFRDVNYWQQSAVIETDHNNVPVCEKLVQSMPIITHQLKQKRQANFAGLSVLASRSPSQVDVSEVEKQRAAFSDYGHCNELLCKIHARSRIARQLRRKSRRESKQFTLPSGYKVAYTSTNAHNRSYKFNKSKHHYQPPVQFQRSLSCSVAVLNSLSLPASKHRSKRHRDSSESSSSKKPLLGTHKKPKLNFHQILTLICLASLAFASQCSMSIIAPFFPLTGRF